ncbi:MAG: DNA replication protein [Hyphomicrobiaceae bacterium]|nr:DNA replication protein [Hyphomicrobiaceae bacterium]
MNDRRAVRSPRRNAKVSHTRAPRINTQESPLAWLAGRKDKDGRPLISREEFEAGERLRRDYHFAMLAQKVTASWSAVSCGSGSRRSAPGMGVDLADNVIAARERVNRALLAVGPELAGVLIDVCCYLKGLESLEKASGWPQRSGKIVLQIALQSLARHYGLSGHAVAQSSGPARVNHWGAPDYRPAVDGAES